jgi:hypothetical protein
LRTKRIESENIPGIESVKLSMAVGGSARDDGGGAVASSSRGTSEVGLMSFRKGIAETVRGGLKLVASRFKPRQQVKARETKVAVSPDPRFTKDQLEKLRARTENAKDI